MQALPFSAQNQGGWSGPIQLPVGNARAGPRGIRHQRGHHLNISTSQLVEPRLQLIQSGVFARPETLMGKLQQGTG